FFDHSEVAAQYGGPELEVQWFDPREGLATVDGIKAADANERFHFLIVPEASSRRACDAGAGAECATALAVERTEHDGWACRFGGISRPSLPSPSSRRRRAPTRWCSTR